jgi:hypothetical protein
VNIKTLVVFFVVILAATADTLSYGNPGAIGSDWAQEFVEQNSVMPITQVQLQMLTPGVTFTSLTSAYNDESQSDRVTGWTDGILFPGQTEAYIAGPGDQNNFYFTIGFSPVSTSTPFDFAVQMWDGKTFDSGDSVVTSWDGQGWGYTMMAEPLVGQAPEPASLGLLGSAIAGLGILGLRRRKKP